MQSGVTTTVVAESALVTVTGELDIALASTLRADFQGVLEQGVETVLLDISGVTFADTAGLDGLLWCRQRAVGVGVGCGLTTPPPALLRLMQVARAASMSRGPRLFRLVRRRA
ncbi:STAS domain-containing protein [Nocardioides sp. SYSU DS0663]|uniref:STAS domain-containing protein n=1 Tax=Nocardioides sp. SYSU DS0663 TaxID=3416445 RepID=UPI003F4B7487